MLALSTAGSGCSCSCARNDTSTDSRQSSAVSSYKITVIVALYAACNLCRIALNHVMQGELAATVQDILHGVCQYLTFWRVFCTAWEQARKKAANTARALLNIALLGPAEG